MNYAGLTNQSETRRHISYCVAAKCHIIHMGAYEHHPSSSSLTRVTFAQLDLL